MSQVYLKVPAAHELREKSKTSIRSMLIGQMLDRGLATIDVHEKTVREPLIREILQEFKDAGYHIEKREGVAGISHWSIDFPLPADELIKENCEKIGVHVEVVQADYLGAKYGRGGNVES